MPSIDKSPQKTAFEQKITSYGSKGLVLKMDPALLQDTQYSEFSNLTSNVEGSLNPRTGNRRINNDSNWDIGTEAVVHSITKLHAGTNLDYYYAGGQGDFGSIYRAVGPIASTGATMPLERVAIDTSSTVSGVSYENMRFSGATYNAGAIGTPYIFFACPIKMLKDNGTLESGDGSGDATTKLQRWGIVPPTQPVVAVLDAITILPATEVVTGSGRINTMISGLPPGLTGANLYVVTPNSMIGIQEGMLLNFNSGTLAIVEVVSLGSFTVYLPSTPSVGWTITSGQATATPSAAPGTVSQFTLGSTLDASFDGLAQDGYDTTDPVHIAIGISEPTKITDLRLRVMVNSATGVDYYEKEILPSQVQAQASVTDTSLGTLPQLSQTADSGVTGPYDIVDNIGTRAKAVFLNQVPPSQPTGTPMWTELDIPKDQFMKVGRAGGGLYTWKNVVAFQVVEVGDPSATVWIGSIYIAGGFGPEAESNTANVPLLPYDYLITYRNTITGQESNPSPSMIQDFFVTPLRQAVKLTLLSSSDNQISNMPTANTATVNKAAIAVYRRGGAFSDGLYRLVGYADNSVASTGGGNLVTFIDHQSDASLEAAPLISFDNDPPVRSTLPVPFVASWASYTLGTGTYGYNRFTVTVISSPNNANLAAFLTVGSVITIAPNTTKQETCAIIAVTATTIDTFFQYDHSDATAGPVFITCDSVVGKAANLCVSAFDSMFVAGDSNNPHVLYKSKTGRPEVFPVVELDTGIADQINVGSPSNPIMNLTEYNGQILCMNLDCLFIVQVFLGQMQAPLRTPATRGLYASWAWCKVDNEIWYLAYDGIYSWSGGESTKRSEAIDPLFHGLSIGPYAAIDLTGKANSSDPPAIQSQSSKDFITMHYSKQRVYMTYRDVNLQFHRLRYDTIYDRWAVENLGDNLPGLVFPTAVFVQEETGFAWNHTLGFQTESDPIIAKCVINSAHTPNVAAYLYMDDVGTSDGWVNLPTDGAPIAYSFMPAAYTLGAPSFQKQYSDCISELNNDTGLVQIQTYYNFSPVPDPQDFFTIAMPASSMGRRRVIFSFQRGYGKEAYSLQFRYSGSSNGNVTFYSNTFNYFSLDQLQIGRAFDWDDLGTPDDKRLYEVTFWYDAKQAPHTWVLDTITGITNTQTVTEDVQEFVLEPLAGSFTGPTWTQVTFPINDTILTAEGIPNSIVKKVRLRPKQPGGAATICVDDTTVNGGVDGQYGNQRWGLFKVGANFYKVTYDGGIAKQLFIEKSTDGGNTWTNVTGIKVINGGGSPATGMAVTFDGTFIYAFYAASGSSNPRAMTVSKFDTGDDSWETDNSVTPTMDTTATTSGYGPTNMSIGVKPNGKIEILYNGSHQVISGVTYARAYWAEYASGSWSAGAAIAGQTGIAKDFLASQILVSSANRTHIVLQTLYPSAMGYDIYHVSIPDGGAQQTFQLLASDASTRVRDFPSAVGLGLDYIDAASVERIAIPYIGGGNATDGPPDFGPSFSGRIVRTVDANNPVWINETFETATQISGFQPAFEVLASMAYDVSTDSLYTLWVTPTSYGTPGGSEVVSTSGNVLFSVNSGSGWSGPVLAESFAAPIVASGVLGTFFSAGVLTLLIDKVNSTTFYM